MKETKYLELLKKGEFETLKNILEEEIRKQGALKTNSKSRFNALVKLDKENEKKARLNLKGYGVKDGKYYFTNSYLYAILNDSCGREENTSFPIDGVYNIDSRQELDPLYISINDLSYYVKTKENYKNDYFENISFDYKYIKIALDILGTKDISIYSSQDKQFLIFENKNNERVAIIGCKVH